ncbi:MAG TPA: DUF2127 domain-containing protein [Candidatus Binataceae bacterium]|nr:DUF2127 domain-containing protein [Candidatus Binataceae bacterium]
MNEQRIHLIFEVSVLLKGAHAVIECVGGLALAFATTTSMAGLVNRLTQDELIEDPHDFVATHLSTMVQEFSVTTKNFYAFYLISHGIVKLALVIGLLRNKLWAYPASLVVLVLFMIYQIYRFYYTLSVGLMVLTVFDLIVMVLIWHEYGLMRRHRPVIPPTAA